MTLELYERRHDRVLNERLRIEQSKFKALEKKYNRVLNVLILTWCILVIVCGLLLMYPVSYNESRPMLRLM